MNIRHVIILISALPGLFLATGCCSSRFVFLNVGKYDSIARKAIAESHPEVDPSKLERRRFEYEDNRVWRYPHSTRVINIIYYEQMIPYIITFLLRFPERFQPTIFHLNKTVQSGECRQALTLTTFQKTKSNKWLHRTAHQLQNQRVWTLSKLIPSLTLNGVRRPVNPDVHMAEGMSTGQSSPVFHIQSFFGSGI